MAEEALKPEVPFDELANELEQWNPFGESTELPVPKADKWVEKDPLLEDNEEDDQAFQQETIQIEPVVEERAEREDARQKGMITSDKQILFFIQKFKDAQRICEEAGLSLEVLQKKVAYLSYKLKRYIPVEALYRETDPVTCNTEGIHITRGHLVETGFKTGDRFRVNFKDKHIILTKL